MLKSIDFPLHPSNDIAKEIYVPLDSQINPW